MTEKLYTESDLRARLALLLQQVTSAIRSKLTSGAIGELNQWVNEGLKIAIDTVESLSPDLKALADLKQSELREPSPCRVEGHKQTDWVVEPHGSAAHCTACARAKAQIAAAYEAILNLVLERMRWHAAQRDSGNFQGELLKLIAVRGDESATIAQSIRGYDIADAKAALDALLASAEAKGRLEFSRRNRIRCEHPNGFNHPLSGWSTSDWFLAILGELGEAANAAKKLNRVRDGIPGNKETPQELNDKLRQELGDAAVYLDLIAQSLGFYIQDAAFEVFESKSREIGYTERIADLEKQKAEP